MCVQLRGLKIISTPPRLETLTAVHAPRDTPLVDATDQATFQEWPTAYGVLAHGGSATCASPHSWGVERTVEENRPGARQGKREAVVSHAGTLTETCAR